VGVRPRLRDLDVGGNGLRPVAVRFRTLVGASPMAYLTRWRMLQAARLLRESRAGMADIAGRSATRPRRHSRRPSSGRSNGRPEKSGGRPRPP